MLSLKEVLAQTKRLIAILLLDINRINFLKERTVYIKHSLCHKSRYHISKPREYWYLLKVTKEDALNARMKKCLSLTRL